MKKLFKYLAVMGFSALAASCEAEFVSPGMDKTSQVVFTIEDFIPEVQTKSAAQITDSEIHFQWSEDDVIGIFPKDGYQAIFSMESGAGSDVAVFDGGSWGLKSDAIYYAYYPFSKSNFESMDNREAVSYSYEGQEACFADGNGIVDVGKYDFMASGPSTVENGNVTFNFKHLGALCKISFKSPASTGYSQASIEAGSKVFSLIGHYDATSENVELVSEVEKSNQFVINFPAGNHFEANDMVELYFLMSPVDLSSQPLKLRIIDTNSNYYESEITGRNIQAGMSYSWDVAFDSDTELPDATALSWFEAEQAGDRTVKINAGWDKTSFTCDYIGYQVYTTMWEGPVVSGTFTAYNAETGTASVDITLPEEYPYANYILGLSLDKTDPHNWCAGMEGYPSHGDSPLFPGGYLQFRPSEPVPIIPAISSVANTAGADEDGVIILVTYWDSALNGKITKVNYTLQDGINWEVVVKGNMIIYDDHAETYITGLTPGGQYWPAVTPYIESTAGDTFCMSEGGLYAGKSSNTVPPVLSTFTASQEVSETIKLSVTWDAATYDVGKVHYWVSTNEWELVTEGDMTDLSSGSASITLSLPTANYWIGVIPYASDGTQGVEKSTPDVIGVWKGDSKRLFPMHHLNITQGRDGGYSHKDLNAYDLAGEDSGIDYFTATGTYEVTAVLSMETSGYANTILFYDADNDVTLALVHMDSINTNQYYVGRKFYAGEVMYMEGTAGQATGNHIHMEIGKGWQNTKPKRVVNGTANYQLANLMDIEDYFYIDSSITVVNDGGYTFESR